ncbi:hypothetical protein SAMN02746095_02403 [Acidocella aminolytica 101 = DSM 11237]|jgi:hypothetical protein|uniref:Uncharacterized protein n=1 Tax=Acidocella aminolytica 101 = DSM 11237 TaxID=1120923 RepID=A0A0D6PIS3_9PROT|nr:hypothetical protein Aam_104_005 [Acidocella aminolytica 101 = DSM 11237]GBQ42027.1 hypothetical protein AA11237_2846 [Acidocella aminolytica 101 = DSM 11237]SHF19107.1 hypothetical protein SAMN02746095_02403 [Acidocella aminolytica 101 = DSM 11237]
MCILCATDTVGYDSFRRVKALQLLALVEDDSALPVDAALRIAREILVLTESERSVLSCDTVNPPDEYRIYSLKEPDDDC